LPEPRELLKAVYADCTEMHGWVIEQLAWVQTNVTHHDPAVLMDAIYALKQSAKHVEDLRKELNKSLERLQKLGCLAMAQLPEARLDGQWATGSPLITEQPYMPDSKAENYPAFMEALGISGDLLARGTVKPSFSGVQNLIADAASEGRPVPHALKSAKLIKKFTVVARSKHVID
jgi:hypothetical protein